MSADLGPFLGAGFTLVCQRITFPTNTIVITLDAVIVIGKAEPFLGEATIHLINFDPDIRTTKFLGDDRRCAGIQEGIKNHVAGIRACENEFGDQLF